MFKKSIIIFVLFILLLSVTSPAHSATAKKVVLRLAHGLDINHPVHKAMVYMSELVSEQSCGSLQIDVYPNGQLGDEKECIEALQLGYLTMTKVSAASMESFVSDFRIFSFPYLFRDNEHFWKVCNGAIGQRLLNAGQFRRIKGLCYYDAGARSFYSKKPVNSPDDLHRDGVILKVRVMSSQIAREMISSMGGVAAPMSWGELYTSLDQGVVDAAENNPPSLLGARHYEVCKYYSLDEHSRIPDMLVISTLIWNRLSAQNKQILQTAIEKSVIYQRQLWKQAEDTALEKMKSAGLNIIIPDKTLFRQAVEPMFIKYADTPLGELIKEIQEVR